MSGGKGGQSVGNDTKGFKRRGGKNREKKGWQGVGRLVQITPKKNSIKKKAQRKVAEQKGVNYKKIQKNDAKDEEGTET